MAVVELPSVMNIASASELKSVLTLALDANESTELEAGSVESIDASAIQLLLSFIQEASIRGNSCCWNSASNELKASVELLGLSDELMLI